jgi:hypothetical protein
MVLEQVVVAGEALIGLLKVSHTVLLWLACHQRLRDYDILLLMYRLSCLMKSSPPSTGNIPQIYYPHRRINIIFLPEIVNLRMVPVELYHMIWVDV